MSVTNIKKLSELASTALASYAYFEVDEKTGSGLETRLQKPDSDRGVEMATLQARDFENQYEIVDIRPNDATGFSGTLFSDKLDNNKKVLALRGTEFKVADQFGPDVVLTDVIDIGGTGYANSQAVQINGVGVN